jgi:hypothetical protein
MRPWTLLTVFVLGVSLSTSVESAQTVQEVRVHWDASVGRAPQGVLAPGSAQPSESFTVLELRRLPGKPPRQRNPELSSDQLMVVAVNALGETVDTQLILDPRVIRAETPDQTGEVSGQVLDRADPEFLLTLPDDAAITEVRLYQPRWTGSAFTLDLLGTISLR